MKITVNLLAAILMGITAFAEDRPTLQLPHTFAIEEIETTESTTPVISALLRNGSQWRAEVLKNSTGTARVWIGDGTNILAGDTVTAAQRTRLPEKLAFTLDCIYADLNDPQYKPYQGEILHNGAQCWSFESSDGVAILINTNTSLPVYAKIDDGTTEYSEILLTADEIDELLRIPVSTNSLLEKRHRTSGSALRRGAVEPK